MLRRPQKPAPRLQVADALRSSTDLRLQMLNANSMLPDPAGRSPHADDESAEESSSSSSSSLLPAYMRSPKLFCSPARSNSATARNAEPPVTTPRTTEPPVTGSQLPDRTPHVAPGSVQHSTVRPQGSTAPHYTERFEPTSLVMYPVPEAKQYKGGRGLNIRPLPAPKGAPGSFQPPTVSKNIVEISPESAEDPFDHDYEETSRSRKRKPAAPPKRNSRKALKAFDGATISASRKTARGSAMDAGRTSNQPGGSKIQRPVERSKPAGKTVGSFSALETVSQTPAIAAGASKKNASENTREKLVLKLNINRIRQRLMDLEGRVLSAAEQKEKEKLLLKLEECDLRLALFDTGAQEEGNAV